MFDSVLTSAITLLTIKKWFGNYKENLQLSMINIIHRDVCTCVAVRQGVALKLKAGMQYFVDSKIHQEEYIYVFVASILA